MVDELGRVVVGSTNISRYPSLAEIALSPLKQLGEALTTDFGRRIQAHFDKEVRQQLTNHVLSHSLGDPVPFWNTISDIMNSLANSPLSKWSGMLPAEFSHCEAIKALCHILAHQFLESVVPQQAFDAALKFYGGGSRAQFAQVTGVLLSTFDSICKK